MTGDMTGDMRAVGPPGPPRGPHHRQGDDRPSHLALPYVHRKAAEALARLAADFTPEMRLTFVARHPANPECYVVVTDEPGDPGLAGLAALWSPPPAEVSS